MAFMTEIERSQKFTHSAYHGTVMESERCDTAGGYVLFRPKRLTDEQFASDVAEIFCWYYANMVERFNGFQLGRCLAVHKVK